MNQQNISLALSGGSARGAFTLGVLKFFEEQNIQIKRYSGSSIGALISVAHASGISAKEQLSIFSSKELKKLIKFNYLRFGVFHLDLESPILNKLFPIKDLKDLPKKVYINAYDLKSKQLYYFDQGDCVQLCAASSALVPLFKPIRYENKILIDGGLFDNLPVKPLLQYPEDIYSINLIHPRKSHLRQKWYDSIEFGIKHSKHCIGSKKMKNYSMWTFKDLDSLYKLGYEEAVAYFKSVE